jgi:hypothetical protein
MRRVVIMLSIALLAITACNKGAEKDETSAGKASAKKEKANDPHETQKIMGRQVAEHWLAFGDEGNWESTWDNSSTLFKKNMDKEQWVMKAKAVRDPLGELMDRNLVVVKFKTSRPGLPDGDYVIAHFRTRWEHKAQSVETVSVVKESDGMWRVTGYFIN